MNSKHALLSITIIGATLTGCPNYIGPDESGRLCDPNSIMSGSEGCDIPGCDSNQTAIFCTADARAWDCRLNGGVCDTTPDCIGGGVDCVRGAGACARHGLTSCPAGATIASLCSASPGSPGGEVCGNGIDEDCDGAVDNGCSTCVPSGAEICDNLDNNCSGAVDEGCDDDNDDHCDSGMSMGASGSLACPRTPHGRSTGDDCDDTTAGRSPSAVEVCGNGIDEDCNGSDLVCPPTCTYRGPEVCGNGIDDDCVGGDMVCMCVATVEVCDNVDNDCDGTRDDGVTQACYTGTAGTRYVGACRDGVATCSSGSFGSCIGQVMPVAEVCGDAIDNDCDGTVNEGCSTCTYRGPEVCGNGIDDDCSGGDLICPPVCGIGALVGSELCVEYSGSVPTLVTVAGVSVTSPSIAIFNCGGGISSFSPGTSSCVPLTESCFGWLATTATQGASADERNFTTYVGYSGRSASSMGVRVFARTGGTLRELSDLSWVAYDPSGSTYSSYAGAEHSGDRVYRIMAPVRVDCAVAGARPPNRY